MKQKTNKSAQFKQWILSIGINRWISTSKYLPDEENKLFWIFIIKKDGSKHIDVAYRDTVFGWTNGDTWYDFDKEVKYWKRIKYPMPPNGL